MKDSLSNLTHDELLRRVAEKYREKGFRVQLEPSPSEFPFDLGSYRPDLLAVKDSLSLVIEVKTTTNVSFDQLSSLAAEIKQHEGWRFLLVTGQDVSGLDSPLSGEYGDSFSIVDESAKHAQRLLGLNEFEAAYLFFWISLERLMRLHAQRIALPIERLAPSILIKQLYSNGEMTIEQFDLALLCQKIRNSLVHGFPTPNLAADLRTVETLFHELRNEWWVEDVIET